MKKIFYTPVKSFYVGQYFGENKACINPNDSTDIIPCDGTNPPEGYVSLYGPQGHKGIDIPAKRWTPIVSMREGVVRDIDTNIRTGYDVRVEYIIDGRMYLVIYEHMVKWNVEIGDVIKTGQLIGWVGSTGYSTGPHLHLQIMDESGVVDPMEIIDTRYYAGDLYKLNGMVANATQQIKILQGQIAIFLSKG